MNNSSHYAKAGVDIAAGDRVKKRIAELTRNTFTPNVLHQDGAFGGMFSLSRLPFKNPVLVSSVDGVGTKTKIALATGEHTGIGFDLVNHCINDILTCGAVPLFFLDYFACGRQDEGIVLQLIEGMSQACQAADMALIGGETAQMPDVYSNNDYDLAGTIVGAVDEDQIIDTRRIAPGDVILGLSSSGLHTNGYTLARKVLLDQAGLKLNKPYSGFERTLGQELLIPHRSYLAEFHQLKQALPIHGLAHITGGGFEGNITRILPQGCQAVINPSSWRPPFIFQFIQSHGDISWPEMYRVFNMGIGMCVITGRDHAEKALDNNSLNAIEIGEVIEGDGVAIGD